MNENTEGPQSMSAFIRGAVPDFDAEAWLSSIVTGAEDAIIGKTLDGNIVSWNPAAEGLFGYRADEVLGRPVSLLADPARSNEMPDILERLRRGQRIPGFETTRRRKDGTLVPVWLSISPIRNRGGTLIGASKIARDFTKQKKTEERLRLLSADMAHRTKNTLAIVLGIVRLTKREDVTEYRKAIEDRLMALDRANSLLTGGNGEGAGLEATIRQAVNTFRIEKVSIRFQP